MRQSLLTVIATAAALATGGAGVQAQGQPDLADAVRKALETNPEVTARLNALRASGDAVDVARAARRPKVDLDAEVGRAQDTFDAPSRRSPNQTASLSRTGVSLSVTQLLWDGRAVANEINRLDHERMARWFDFNEASEQAALEVTRAWIDVQRFRRMVTLAEDSYVQHRYAFDQIQSRVRAGVGRGVDQEQAAARLALAESNLTTERSNLHDVSERYLRLVGEPSPARMPRPSGLDQGLPAQGVDALSAAARQSAAVSAAIENLRAARATAKAREGSAWQPRVEARARVGGGNNFDGVADQRRDANVGIYLNWNLYSGGADQARIRQQAHVVNQAADLRDKACRDVRQTTAIAHNDVRKLAEQLVLLDRNTLAIEKARDAYRQQFDIGQRSLLDLLNAENELYTARRAYANADHDLLLAQARTQAAMGRLITNLGLRPAQGDAQVPEADKWSAGEDAAARCPLDAQVLAQVSRADLDARAKALAVATPTAAPAAAPAPAGAAAAAPKVAPAPGAAQPMANPSAAVEQRLSDWAAAWSAKNVDTYLAFYADGFKPGKADRARWTTERRRLLGKPGPIEVAVARVDSKTLPDGNIVTTFDQNYSSSNFKDRSRKSLVWSQVGGQWRIVRESNR